MATQQRQNAGTPQPGRSPIPVSGALVALGLPPASGHADDEGAIEMKGIPMCQHRPRCPGASCSDGQSARVVAAHPEQGWSLLCNGIIALEDSSFILPDGSCVAPTRPGYVA